MNDALELAESAMKKIEDSHKPVVYTGKSIPNGKIMSSFERMNYPAPGWTAGKFSNVSKLDTKGYIPLEVQIKRYLLAGVRLQAYRNQFTSEDYLDAYSDIPTITEDMDFTEIKEVVDQINFRLNERRKMKAENVAAVSTTAREAARSNDSGKGAATSGAAVDSVAGNESAATAEKGNFLETSKEV